MWKKVTIAAAIGLASTQLAFAQSVDPDGANRGFPANAEPGLHYYNGQLQGGGSVVVTAPTAPGFQSRPAALPRPAGVGRAARSPTAAFGWDGQQDEVGVDLSDRASSPYAGGTG